MIKIEGMRAESLHPDAWPRFIVQEGNLRHEYFGSERFAAMCEQAYGSGVTVHVVEVTTMGSECDEYLLIKVEKTAEPADDDDTYWGHVLRALADLEERLVRIEALIQASAKEESRG